jgi:high-affinity Fe2+/Pb2+ permease
VRPNLIIELQTGRMFPAFVITLREGLEAFLIVAC